MGKRGAEGQGDDFHELRFKARPNLSTMYFALGLFQMAVGAFGFYVGGSGVIFLCVGVLVIYFSRWFATTDLLVFRRDSMVVSIAPLRSPQELSYGEIDEIVKKSPKAALLRLRGREVRLPIASLATEDVERALAAIQEGRERGWAATSSIGSDTEEA